MEPEIRHAMWIEGKKCLKEHLDLIREWRSLETGADAILATVVSTRGSVYRKPGARMLLVRDKWLAGSISGGCVESDLLQTAWDRTEKGPARVTYDASSPEDAIFGFGLGCNGVAEVLLERLPKDGGALLLIEQVIQKRRAQEMATAISPGNLLGKIWPRWTNLPKGQEYLFEKLTPPQSLVIFGAGHDAIPLAKLAKGLGWHVAVVDSRSAYATQKRFPDADRVHVRQPGADSVDEILEPESAVVLMTHSYAKDLEQLNALNGKHGGYVGVLGPRLRTHRLVADAGADLARLHAPIGLDLGAEGPDEIALSIIAEILAYARQKSGRSLSKSGDSETCEAL